MGECSHLGAVGTSSDELINLPSHLQAPSLSSNYHPRPSMGKEWVFQHNVERGKRVSSAGRGGTSMGDSPAACWDVLWALGAGLGGITAG